ncbi:MAG: hypothetical protein ACLQBL_06695 [Polyangiaceae bacterium]
MLTVPFLTKLDPRGAIKGSRDPLGVQSIWTRFGRHVVGNLTTVSTSVRDFTTLLLGYYFAEQVASDDPGSELGTFLKWEQLAAYARAAVNNDFAFRGTERVQKALSEGARVSISDDQASQILANQKIYGLWGLYSVPGRSSGLLDGDPTRLTSAARELVEGFYIPHLDEQGGARVTKRLVEILRQRSTRIEPTGADRRILEAVAHVLRPRLLTRERDVFRLHLLFGGPDDRTLGRQTQLASLLAETVKDASFAWSPRALADLERRSLSLGDDGHSLAACLHRIRACEAVIAPSAALFIHLLGMDGKSITDAVNRLRKEWGARVALVPIAEIRELEGELSGGDPVAGRRWIQIAEATSTGDYRTLVTSLVEQNRAIMEARGSASWVEVRDDRFHVRFHEERGDLPQRDDLATMWRHSYFLDALRSVTGQIGATS